MPLSIRTFLVTSVVAVLSFSDVEARPNKHPAQSDQVNLSKYAPSLSNGSASLPPPTGMTLKAITLGRGTQNYTCAPGSAAAPVAVGAIATLLDLTPLIPHLHAPTSKVLNILNQLPSYLINYSFDQIANSSIPACGHHYFTAAGVPTFELGKKGNLSGKKAAGIAAPGGKEVDWLQLTAVQPSSEGLKVVYRVHTVKGKPPKTCEGHKGEIEVQYAAQYWFYG